MAKLKADDVARAQSVHRGGLSDWRTLYRVQHLAHDSQQDTERRDSRQNTSVQVHPDAGEDSASTQSRRGAASKAAAPYRTNL